MNRKTPDEKLLAAYPAGVRAYDLLLEGESDLRAQPFRQRRARLEAFVGALNTSRIDLSPLQAFSDWRDLAALRANPPAGEPRCAEGLMLKRWDSLYQAGRPRGPWFKWKRDPHLVDAVLMYAQRGHGKRSSFYSDFTFGVWREDEIGVRSLTPVGKAYFGFTDEELKRLDSYVRNHTTERFGPVRQVRADGDSGLVLEVAFEGLQRSSCHRSGTAMRFPASIASAGTSRPGTPTTWPASSGWSRSLEPGPWRRERGAFSLRFSRNRGCQTAAMRWSRWVQCALR